MTVTGESPLIDVTSSTLASNIDPRQMAEIPVNGRDWASLVVMAAGNRTNAQGNGGQPTPVEERDRRDFQLNVDGQQVTQNMSLGTAGNPLFSRDAIAEFQFLSNRFDATQGRSSGVQVNVVTKAGTNTASGRCSGYFRDDAFNADGLHHRQRAAVFEPAAQHDVRWPDQARPDPLLRQLRVRARAADLQLHHPVAEVQHRPAGDPGSTWAACAWTSSSRRRCA